MTTNGSPNRTLSPPSDDELFKHHASDFLQKIGDSSISSLMFFTFKDNSGKYTKMDKVRKWVSKWATTYIIVRSPVGGYHFHGIGKQMQNTAIRHLRGIHLHIQPLGDKKEKLWIPTETPTYESHPLIDNYTVSVFHMDVMRQLRLKFGGKKTSLPARLQARASRMRSLTIRDRHLKRSIEYLKKNYNESNKIMYDDIISR